MRQQESPYIKPPILVQEAVAELEAGLATLLEMFPHCYRVEAAHCLTLVFPPILKNNSSSIFISKQAGGDLQKAAQLIITRAELGEELRPTQVFPQKSILELLSK